MSIDNTDLGGSLSVGSIPEVSQLARGEIVDGSQRDAMNMSNREKGDAFARRVGQYLKHKGHRVKPDYSVEVGLRNLRKKAHRFDYGSKSLLVECKFYDWTAGGNSPSAKISTLNESMIYFHAAPSSFRKMAFISKTGKNGIRNPETLAERYVRMYGHLVPDDVEVWEFDGETLVARQLLAPQETENDG